MAKEEMIPILRELNVTSWRDAGFKGQGIKVWNTEDNVAHGANTRQMILDVAPGADVVSMGFGYITNNDGFVQEPTTNDGTMSFKDYYYLINPDIISRSIKNWSREQCWVDYCADIFSKTKTPVFNCAGNEGADDEDTMMYSFPSEYCILMGALNYPHNIFTRASYSSVGKELDFSQSVGWWAGTSASTPFQVGIVAIIMSRYGKMKIEEVYKYLKMISRDLGDEGEDYYYGWGQPYLPPVAKKYITMVVDQLYFHVDGQTETMDTAPVNKEGNVFVPIRAIAESLGYAVEWNEPYITIGGRVKLAIHSNVMFVNGRKVFLNFAPYIGKNDRTLVPVRAIAEAFNCKVDWIQSEKKIMILEV